MTHHEPDQHVLTLNEAAEAYPDEWVFMQVTERDERGSPEAGIVLAHRRSRKALVETEIAVGKAARISLPVGARGFTTFKGPRFRTNEEWRAYRARMQAARDGKS